MMMRLLSLLFVFVLSAAPVWAVEPDEMLADPALEARARVISQDLRCVVCQNETIDDSNATLAKDMRRLVRERVKAGDSNDEVIAYMVDRYGEFVLLRPRLTATTALLWFGPLALFLIGAVVVFRHVKRVAAADALVLSAEEMKQADALLQAADPSKENSA